MYDKNADCPSDLFYGTPVNNVVGNMSFHTLSTIIAAACTVLAIILNSGLALSHLSRYTKREEQRQLVRISITPSVISGFCFLGVWFQNTSGFLKPIGEYYECFSLIAVFLLFMTFATPLQERGQSIFGNLPTLQERNGGADMSTYYRLWFMTLQIIPVRLITLIATLAISGSECKLLKADSKGHTIVSAIQTLSTIVCFISILKMHKLLKRSIDIKSENRKPMAKLLALKILVGLDVLQSLVFSILLSTSAIKPTSTLSLPDLVIGVPGLMVCIECFLFSLMYLWAYSPTPYKVREYESEQGAVYTGKLSFVGALIDVLDVRDVLSAVISMLAAFQGWRSGARGNEGGLDGGYQEYPQGYRK